MYIKLNNGQIEKYPYSINQLRKDNPGTSFPENVSNELLSEWNIYSVTSTAQPSVTYKQNIVEGTPELVDGQWIQTWIISEKSQDEINVINEQLRSEAYRNESDPLFFKWQRGEIDRQVWLDKVTEIKQRYS